MRFLLTGSGPLKGYLRRVIKSLSLEKKIVLLGHKDHYTDMPKLYLSSDVIVVPSICCEGTPLAILEAMACKKSVITTDVGGINDMGTNKIHKLSSEFRIKEIVKNMLEIISNEELRTYIAENCFHFVKKQRNINSWKKNWKILLDSIIS